MKTILRVIFLLLVGLFLIGLVGCNKNHIEKSETNIKGNTNNNMLMGGRVLKQGENIYFCSRTEILSMNNLFKKDILSTDTLKIKKFIREPRELYATEEYLFLKLTTGLSSNSFLYRINRNGNNKKTVIRENVAQYMIYENHIFYILEDEATPGLFICDFNGNNVKKLIDKPIAEFICNNNSIIYISKDTIQQYHLDTRDNYMLLQYSGTTFSYLEAMDEWLFFVAYTSVVENGENCIYMMNTKTNELKNIYNGFASYLHVVEPNCLIFQDENGYNFLDFTNNTAMPFLRDFHNLTELYVFGSDIFFYNVEYKGEDSEESVYYVDINTMNVQKLK